VGSGFERELSAIRRSRIPLYLWIATTLFIAYGTIVPFHLVASWSAVVDHLARVGLNPLVSPITGRRISIPDAVANVLLFMPFGCFAALALDRPRHGSAKTAVITALALLLSAGMEALQLFTVDRVTSTADLSANAIGALIGALVAVPAAVRLYQAAGRLGRYSFNEPALYWAVAAAVLVCLAAWAPFDATLDVGSVWHKVKLLRRDPWQTAAAMHARAIFLRDALATVAIAWWLRRRGVRMPVGRAFAAAAAGAGLILPASQIFIESRMPGLQEALIGVAGAVGGAIAARVIDRIRSPAWWWALVALATAASVDMPAPGRLTLVEGFQLLLACVPLGFATALAIESRTRAEWLALTAAFVIGMGAAHFGDEFLIETTTLLQIGLTAAGGWLGAAAANRGWRTFRRATQTAMRIDDRVQSAC
jgi:VanZ family protein